MAFVNVWIRSYTFGRFYQYASPLLFYKQSVHSVDFALANSKTKNSIVFPSTRISSSSSSNRLFEPAQIIDIVKGLVVFGCAIPMCFMDISVVYHIVRAQAAIKLYMFFNMLEVSDKIFLVGNNSYSSRRYAIVYYLPSVKTHWMQSIGLPLNHDVNTVLENYFFG